MSCKVEVKLKVDNEATLCRAIESLGYNYNRAAEGQTLMTQNAYAKAQAEIVLADNNGSNSMASLGFKRQNDGFFSLVGDFHGVRGIDGGLSQSAFTRSINNQYAKLRLQETLAEMNFAITSEEEVENKVKVEATGPNGKVIEGIIDDGQLTMESLNFHGQGCEETMTELATKVGEVQKVEYTDDMAPQVPHVNQVGQEG